MNLAELLGGMAGPDGEDEKDTPKPLPEAAVATLREVYERYAAGCPFKPGDLVTVRAGSDRKGARATRPSCLRFWPIPVRPFDVGDSPHGSGTNAFGARLDIRIAKIAVGEVAAFWTESWSLEAYSPPDPAQ